MSKSTFSPRKNGRKASSVGTVPIIEVAERRRNVRLAKITFVVVAVVGWMVTVAIASTLTSIVWAVLGGFLTALATAVVTSLIVLAWPVLRVLWHWAIEIVTLSILLGGYLGLAELTSVEVAAVVTLTALGGPLVLPFTRRAIMPWIWCVISRHRLRVCFTAFIVSQRHGFSPLILSSWPTPAGERVWIWLRPGLSLKDLEDRRDKLAVACWAKDLRLTPSRRYAALLRVDITRRNPLAATVASPLPDLVPATTTDPTPPVTVSSARTGLDLPDVAEDLFLVSDSKNDRSERGRVSDVKTTVALPVNGTRPAKAPAAVDTDATTTPAGDDIADWL